MGKIAFLFPGQGSQSVGMAQELAQNFVEARTIFDTADEKLGISLSSIIFEGPEEVLKRTENTQPALLTASIAVLEVFKKYGIQADYAAGHSLGEYSALVAAGSLSFEDAVYAVRQRGLFMEEAVPTGVGAMSAILGMKQEELEAITEKVTENGHAVQVANLNCPGQIVISGTAQGVADASRLAKENGAKVIPLQVSGPFHSSLMEPAAEKMQDVLDSITIQDAEIPVLANVSAKQVTDAEEIKEKLVKQIYSPVRWEETINELMALGVDTFIEIGPGKVLSGLVKKVNRRANVIAISDEATINAAAEKLKGE
ncbi:ACP S-malonyltransferase [Fictibacillus sp. KIGAM418]|uniref:Malonyl CoA-acyl carrier protein transacylase n=1 Tax=Fictibacillus marinisediminis TaxID=2878389 RepID=A0A9X2BF71_9BACL|nr:ACP S-malonyltransferase [Fictibacillus marinisediminis]MCK6256977.1 ACP S-malonyltransferase [Fictibacillus marinisediminis]